MTTKHPHSRIILFAREPILGQVKTRLHPAIGQAGALGLYKAMLGRVTETLNSSQLANWELCVTSNMSHKYFITLCNKRDITLQVGTDLGQRMSQAIAGGLGKEQVEKVLIIGSDCPAMSEDYIDSALTALEEGNEVVLGPAEDGGYVLVGMSRQVPEIFEDMPWGSDQVLSQTLQRLEKLGVSYRLLAPLWDVDRPEDLARLSELSPPLKQWDDPA